MYLFTHQEDWQKLVLTGEIGDDEKIETLVAIAKLAGLSTKGDVPKLLARIKAHVLKTGGGKLSAPSAATKKRGGGNDASDTDELTESEEDVTPPHPKKKLRRTKQTASGTTTNAGSKKKAAEPKKKAPANLRTRTSRAKAAAEKPATVTPKPTTSGRIRITPADSEKALKRYGDSITTLKEHYHAAFKEELQPAHGMMNGDIRKVLWLKGYKPSS